MVWYGILDATQGNGVWLEYRHCRLVRLFVEQSG